MAIVQMTAQFVHLHQVERRYAGVAVAGLQVGLFNSLLTVRRRDPHQRKELTMTSSVVPMPRPRAEGIPATAQ
jgi:hypothetical protein